MCGLCFSYSAGQASVSCLPALCAQPNTHASVLQRPDQGFYFHFAQAQPLPASLRQLMLPGHASVTSMGPFISGRSAVDMDVPHSNGMHHNHASPHYQWPQPSSFHRADRFFPASGSNLNASAAAHSGDHQGPAHNVTESLVRQQTADCFCGSCGTGAPQPSDTSRLARGLREGGLAQSELEQRSSIWDVPNEHLGGSWGSDWDLDDAIPNLAGTVGDEALAAEFCAELDDTFCGDHIGGASCAAESGNACFFAAVQHEAIASVCLPAIAWALCILYRVVCTMEQDRPVRTACQTSALTWVMAHCV